MNFGTTRVRAWRDIWGAGQGVGSIDDIPTAGEIVERLKEQYRAAIDELHNTGQAYA